MPIRSPSAGVVCECTFSWILKKWIQMFCFVLNTSNNIVNWEKEMPLLSQIGFLRESQNFVVERDMNILRFCLCNWQKRRPAVWNSWGLVNHATVMQSSNQQQTLDLGTQRQGPTWWVRHGLWNRENCSESQFCPKVWGWWEKLNKPIGPLLLTQLPGDVRTLGWLTNP